MKFPESWLREFTHPAIENIVLADRLTMAGLEVEENTLVAPYFEGVVVALVTSMVPHPNADRLKVCTVQINEHETLQIVCGAPNVEIGIKVPCALPGAVLPGNFTIKGAKLRGVESNGMLCSSKELGIDEAHQGLMILPSNAPLGINFRQYYALNDHILTLKLTPNRADCLSIYGIAREVAAITQSQLIPPAVLNVDVKLEDTLSIQIEDKEACKAYYGCFIGGINAKAVTPDWMERRLTRSGIRLVGAVVDITNYVLLELGQPLHAFDASMIQESITVRWPKQGETLKLLNDKTVVLDPDMLVIADAVCPIALAGVMGGLETAVSGETTEIFLESALFAQEIIAGRARRAMAHSDSAYRFERGVDPLMVEPALMRATQLILEICGGQAGPVHGLELSSIAPKIVSVRASRVKSLLGVEVSHSDIVTYLTALGMPPQQNDDVFSVSVPSYRMDILLEEDLIEEIARLYGYDQIPERRAYAPMSMLPVAGTSLSRVEMWTKLKLRDYHEVINYAFIDSGWEKDFHGNQQLVQLQNPIASHMNVMRSSLLAGLVDTLRKNLNRKQERVRIFEVGRVFIQEGPSIVQPEKLAGLAFGFRCVEQWGISSDWVDFYDVKADIESLFYPRLLRFERAEHSALHPGRAANILCDDEVIGILGELHPQWSQQYDLPRAPIVFELDFNALTIKLLIKAIPISRQPIARRDIALIADEALPVQKIIDVLAGTDPLLQSIKLFDVYRGPGVAVGKKSLAFAIFLQDRQKTLTDEEIDTVIDKCVVAAEVKCGATLRA